MTEIRFLLCSHVECFIFWAWMYNMNCAQRVKKEYKKQVGTQAFWMGQSFVFDCEREPLCNYGKCWKGCHSSFCKQYCAFLRNLSPFPKNECRENELHVTKRNSTKEMEKQKNRSWWLNLLWNSMELPANPELWEKCQSLGLQAESTRLLLYFLKKKGLCASVCSFVSEMHHFQLEKLRSPSLFPSAILIFHLLIW